MFMSQTTEAWWKGLLTAFITSFSTAMTGMMTMPDVFNFSEHGMANVGKIVIVPSLVSVFAYLQRSPLPGTLTVQQQTTQQPSGAMTTTTTAVKTE